MTLVLHTILPVNTILNFNTRGILEKKTKAERGHKENGKTQQKTKENHIA